MRCGSKSAAERCHLLDPSSNTMGTLLFSDQQGMERALCRGAGRLLLFSLITVLLLSAAIASDLLFRKSPQTQETEERMVLFSPFASALWTSGSQMRHPETTHPAVALRFAPGLECPP
jgi:hypothetical protein